MEHYQLKLPSTFLQRGICTYSYLEIHIYIRILTYTHASVCSSLHTERSMAGATRPSGEAWITPCLAVTRPKAAVISLLQTYPCAAWWGKSQNPCKGTCPSHSWCQRSSWGVEGPLRQGKTQTDMPAGEAPQVVAPCWNRGQKGLVGCEQGY